MNTFVTSDTHFGHANILKYDNSQFDSIEEQDEAIIESWNSLISNGDEVYHLGDFALSSVGYARSILSRLNGQIHLVRGNHEKTATDPKLRGMFTSISHYKELKRLGETFCLFHYPIHVWNKCHRGSFMLHGHTHKQDTYEIGYKRLNVGIMNHGYSPLPLERVIEIVGEAPAFTHH